MLLGGNSIGIRIGMIRKKQPCEDHGELNCRQNKQLGQRPPQSGKEFNVLDEQKEGKCGRCIEHSGEVGGEELQEVGRQQWGHSLCSA